MSVQIASSPNSSPHTCRTLRSQIAMPRGLMVATWLLLLSCLPLGSLFAQDSTQAATGSSADKTSAADKTIAADKTAQSDKKEPADTPTASPRQRPTTARITVEERLSRDTAIAKGDLTFDDLKFDLEKGGKFSRSLLTKDIEALDKRTMRIRGYILPASVFKQSGIEEFVLVRDNMECCFGPGAALYDCIIVQMEPGKTADFTTRPVAVRGKFEIKEFTYPDSDEHYAIYKMTASEAK